MRLLKNIAAAAALAAVAVSPVMAQASVASKLSLRSSTSGKKANELAPAFLAGFIVIGGLAVGILAINESSDSP